VCEGTCKVRSFMISVLIRDCSGDQIKEDEMGRAWCMYGIKDVHVGFWWWN
jgi:hypothetical protein